MSNKHWIYTELYSSLYDKWKNERSNDLIQPLEYNFYTYIWDELENLNISNMDDTVLEDLISDRVIFFLKSLKKLRWEKINNYLLRDLNIDSSLLTSQEIDALNILLDIFTWYGNLPNQTDGKFLKFSKNGITQNINQKPADINNYDQEKILATEMVEVKFLENINQFIAPNLEVFGPYKKNDIERIPKRIVLEILLPKSHIYGCR